jgi:hypothetical protein
MGMVGGWEGKVDRCFENNRKGQGICLCLKYGFFNQLAGLVKQEKENVLNGLPDILSDFIAYYC